MKTNILQLTFLAFSWLLLSAWGAEGAITDTFDWDSSSSLPLWNKRQKHKYLSPETPSFNIKTSHTQRQIFPLNLLKVGCFTVSCADTRRWNILKAESSSSILTRLILILSNVCRLFRKRLIKLHLHAWKICIKRCGINLSYNYCDTYDRSEERQFHMNTLFLILMLCWEKITQHGGNMPHFTTKLLYNIIA